MSKKDIDGYWAYEDLFDEIRKRLRTGARDTWLGDSPSRAELEELLHGEQTMIDVVFDASIADVLDEYVTDQRLKDALFGQGIIGACAGPEGQGHRVRSSSCTSRATSRARARCGATSGRHGHDQLRDRRRRPGGRRGARRRRPRRRDRCPARACGSTTAR